MIYTSFTKTGTLAHFIKFTFSNYYELFKERNFGIYLKSSLVVSIISTFISLVIGSLAAYSLARFQMRRKEDIAFWIFSLRFMPLITVAIPIFLLISYVGLSGTYLALILIYISLNLPLTIWLLRGFFAEIPQEIEQAALVDGCSTWQLLIHIVVPLALPGIFAAGVLAFIFSWNEYLFALLITNVNSRTIPVGIATFQTERLVLWGPLTAGGTIATLPVLLLTLVIRRYLVRGLTFGALK
jgi:multiple sugar transport system permease protein